MAAKMRYVGGLDKLDFAAEQVSSKIQGHFCKY